MTANLLTIVTTEYLLVLISVVDPFRNERNNLGLIEITG
jgi:hypothetical protein